MEKTQKAQAEKVAAEQLAAEIEETMKDFFVADVSRRGDTVTLRFLNGQKFTLKAEEVTGRAEA